LNDADDDDKYYAQSLFVSKLLAFTRLTRSNLPLHLRC